MSFDKLLTKVFGSSNQRFLKTVQPLVEQINALEPEIKKLSDEQLRARTADFKERVQREVAGITDKEELKRRERRGTRRITVGGVCRRPGSQRAHYRHAAFRRAVDRRHRLAPGQDRRDANRRRQDAGGDVAGLPQRVDGQGRSSRDYRE